ACRHRGGRASADQLAESRDAGNGPAAAGAARRRTFARAECASAVADAAADEFAVAAVDDASVDVAAVALRAIDVAAVPRTAVGFAAVYLCAVDVAAAGRAALGPAVDVAAADHAALSPAVAQPALGSVDGWCRTHLSRRQRRRPRYCS